MAIRSLLCYLGLLTLSVSAATVNIDSFQQSCLSFEPQKHVYNSTLTVREYIPANTTLSFLDNDATCNRPKQLVSADMCRIAMLIPTSNMSGITYEMWLPREWSGRFLATGNGGIDGCKTLLHLFISHANVFQVSNTRIWRTPPFTDSHPWAPTTVIMALMAMRSIKITKWCAILRGDRT